jgi:ParB family chromosome partitioning protein
LSHEPIYRQVSDITLCAPHSGRRQFPCAVWRTRVTKSATTQKAASFKTQGILAPLLVRELEESKYEVVAGARRLRAAKLAELEKLPVRIVKLTDAEAIEAQCVENLQREDIHPLEEALGFKSLLELGEPAYSIATIASRAGKSEAYVYGRIRLADLIPPVAEAFLKDQITIGHALLIAKLPASQQQEAFAAAFRGQWTSEGNTQVLIPVRELALCGARHNANNAVCVFMQSAAA